MNKTWIHISFFATGLITNALWLLEISTVGWKGIDWVSHTFIAPYVSIISITVVIFFSFHSMVFSKRIRISVFYLTGLLLILLLYSIGFKSIYSDRTKYRVFLYLLAIVPLIISFLHYVICKINTIQITKRHLLYSIIIMYLSLPLSFMLNFLIYYNQHGMLSFMGHPFQNDLIHTIKTGTIFFLFIYGVGFPIIANNKLKFNSQMADI